MSRHSRWLGVALAAAVLVISACSSSAERLPPTPASIATPTSAATCTVTTGVLPPWAQAGFNPPTQSMPYVLGTGGDIVAILFGQPLRSPAKPDRTNKILWVSRVERGGDPLKIDARLDGTDTVAIRTVPDGPGPSTIDLPRSGCWRLTLSWSGHIDHLALPYVPA